MEMSLSETSNVSVLDIGSAASASSVLQVCGEGVARDAALGEAREANTSQGSQEASRAKRPRHHLSTKGSRKATDLSSSFLKKLWEIVENSCFQSICWANDGNSIVIEEASFEREVLARRGCLQFSDIDSMKTFIRQLHLHGFFIIEGDLPRSASHVDETADPNNSKFLYYYNPNFKKEYPFLQRWSKQSAGVRRRASAAFPPELDLEDGPLSSPPRRRRGPAASAGTEPAGSNQDAAPAAAAAPPYHTESPEPNGPSPPGLGPDSGAGGDGLGH
ncbi:heat shock transcription factor, Y-linked-like [Coturnix japonica]|uniref:Heat shock transcription factor, Y-linked-like n=1 Tax=Coturnix japonica TaxID=93934 RepID=A0A8C2UDC7_COTJA|nr:heat shock transcription factor, Y-linked-like [Coturnix japonica]XP_032302126.1 heat shock transcription factor, Y-linked-like [Coturnix japonica]XP_032302127.1 heat shock transcription factor, Y-linked-like [Coturnix japonica]